MIMLATVLSSLSLAISTSTLLWVRAIHQQAPTKREVDDLQKRVRQIRPSGSRA